ncbi:hypothetical protein NGC37_14700 [Pantoea anthophila]|uniref:hypothetical protein n=1 Tax=Pantoea anthophila TaxID=470931 RepID=UPI002DB9C024|nr:hypothetical protein [Pantoea anthophila]MEB7539554.1 hypothetical protein [Pantoea anthophila]
MNKFRFSLAVLLSVSSLPLLASDDFTGQWSGQEKNDNGSLYSTLTLKLKQDNNNITGSYCYVTRSGNKIDCPEDNVSNLKGTANDKKALIEFNSSFGGVKGKANLEIKDDKVLWNLIKDPENGEFYAPKTYALEKEVSQENLKSGMKTFSTSDFTITLVNGCGEFYTVCNKVKYLGLRNKDGKQITLEGKTTQPVNSNKANGMIFTNSGVNYIVNFDPLVLKVTQKNKILVEQSGKWE